jgi:predicted TIM-barrel fold metal-dependent hydrolase
MPLRMKARPLFALMASMLISACGFAPSVDHHQHLFSPAAAALSHPPPLAPVKLPPDLARLLTLRSERGKDAAALRELYAEDAWVLRYSMPGWGQGADASRSMTWLFPGAYALSPVLFRANGPTSIIAGYYTSGEGAKTRYLSYFHMTVERMPDGRQLITSETPAYPIPPVQRPKFADDLISQLDDAGIRGAVVLSNAYFFDGLVPYSGDAYAAVRAENDWTAEQVMRHPDRLVALCSFNPTKDYAVAELERCSENKAFTGVKLHFGTSPVGMDDPEQVAKTRRVFEAANRLRLPLLVHAAGSTQWGADHAETFLKELVAAAPDVQVVVAHLWGGAFYNEAALDVFANAVSSGNPLAKNLYFEVASAQQGNAAMLERVAERMRKIGMERIYFGSDAHPESSWEDFREDVPLTKEEMKTLATNVAPWAQRQATR